MGISVTHPQIGFSSTVSIKSNWKMLFFCRGRKTRVPSGKTLRAVMRANNKLTIMASTLGNEPGLHWWEASALTIMRHPCSPLVKMSDFLGCRTFNMCVGSGPF